jgi:hypothetical protein
MYLPVLLVLVLTLPLLSYWTDTTFAQVLTGISKLSHNLDITFSVVILLVHKLMFLCHFLNKRPLVCFTHTFSQEDHDAKVTSEIYKM